MRASIVVADYWQSASNAEQRYGVMSVEVSSRANGVLHLHPEDVFVVGSEWLLDICTRLLESHEPSKQPRIPSGRAKSSKGWIMVGASTRQLGWQVNSIE